MKKSQTNVPSHDDRVVGQSEIAFVNNTRRTNFTPKKSPTKDEVAQNLVSKYIALRDNPSYLAELAKSNQIPLLLSTIEMNGMNIIKGMLLKDIAEIRARQKDLSSQVYRRQRKELQASRKAEEELTEEQSDNLEVIPKGLGEVIGVKFEEDGELEIETIGDDQVRAVEDLEQVEDLDAEPEQLRFVNARRELEVLIKVGYKGSTLPEVVEVEKPELDYLGRLSALWTTFSSSRDYSTSAADLKLSLSFLYFLSSPLLPSSHVEALPPKTFLPLAFEVFQHLVDNVILETSVAATPSYPDVPGSVILQFVILRTISGVSIDEGFLDLGKEALDSLAILRKEYPSVAIGISEANDTDVLLLQETIESHLTNLSVSRQTEYQPALPPFFSSTSPRDPPHPLLQVNELIQSHLSSWLPAGKILSTRSSTLLDRFVEEAVERNRWDVISSTWEQWGESGSRGGGWTMRKYRRKLAKWYCGEAPFSTYPPVENGRLLRSPRPVRIKQFGELAAGTYRALTIQKAKLEDLGSVSNDEKAKWIDLLCSSKASNGRTHDLARRFYTLFVKRHPRGSLTPFVLPGASLLRLIRVSTPPVSSLNNFTPAVINHFIASITSPASPYSSTIEGAKIDHYDLSILAQCYALTGDLQSMAQVYRKLFQQKMLPDVVDVKTLLTSAARRNPKFSLVLLKQVDETGILMRKEWIGAMMKAVIEFYGAGDSGATSEMRRILVGLEKYERKAIAQAGGSHVQNGELSTRERLLTLCSSPTSKYTNLRNLPLPLRSIIRSVEFDEVSPYSLTKLLLSTQQNRDWRRSIGLYNSAIRGSGFFDEKAFQIIISSLLSESAGSSDSTRDLLHTSLREYIEHAFSSPTHVLSQPETLELSLRGIIRLGDYNAFKQVMRFSLERGLEVPKVAVLDMVRRWAVEQVGKEAFGSVGGWFEGVAEGENRKEKRVREFLEGKRSNGGEEGRIDL